MANANAVCGSITEVALSGMVRRRLTMKEYIEREAVHEKLTQLMKALDVYNCDECQNCGAYKYGLVCDDDCFCGKVAAYLIGNDVVERKHGEWVIKNGRIVCDQCEEMLAVCPNRDQLNDILLELKEIEKFCYNCGADMRSHHDSLCDQTEAELTR